MLELAETTDGQIVSVKKEPRKPRPSEIAAKKAKAAKKRFKKKGPSAQHSRTPPKKKPKAKAAKKRPAKKKIAKRRLVPYAGAERSKSKVKKGVIVRGERLELRLSKREKAKLLARAKATRRTVTSVVVELIEGMR